jgi:hypothetical protein
VIAPARIVVATAAAARYICHMAHPKTDPNAGVPPDLLEPSDPAERERALVAAEADIEAGNGTPHDEVRAWLLDLAAGRSLPPPCDR